MNLTEEETLRRFVRKLSATYDGRKMRMPLVRTHTQSQMPYVYAPDNACRLPCMSLPNGNLGNLTTLSDIDHRNLQRLLSRKVQYNQASVASSSLLRNLVSSFGKILELELRNRLYRLTCKLDGLNDTVENSHKKEAILKAFEEQSLSNDSPANDTLKNRHKQEVIFKAFEDQSRLNESPAVPVSACANFSRVLGTLGSIENRSEQNERRDDGVMDIIFEARIRLHIISNCTVTTSHLKAPARISLLRRPKNGILEIVDVEIDMGILYSSIRKECKRISKEIINGIVGFNIFEKKIRPHPPRRKEKEQEHVIAEDDAFLLLDEHSHKTAVSTVVSEPSSPSRSSKILAHSDAITQATFTSAEDHHNVEHSRKKLIQAQKRIQARDAARINRPAPRNSAPDQKERRKGVGPWLCRMRLHDTIS